MLRPLSKKLNAFFITTIMYSAIFKIPLER